MVFKVKITKGKFIGAIIRRGTGSIFRILDYNPASQEYLRSWDSTTNKYPELSHYVIPQKVLTEFLCAGKWRIIDQKEETEVLNEKDKE